MIDILQGITQPSPDEVRAARDMAGLSQSDAASIVGLASRQRWGEYETGARACDTARWAVFLLSVGQHPTLRVKSA